MYFIREAVIFGRRDSAAELVYLIEEVAVLDLGAALQQREPAQVALKALRRDGLGVGDGGLALPGKALDLRRDLEALLGVAEEVPLEVGDLLLVALDLPVGPPPDPKVAAALLEHRDADAQLCGRLGYGNVQVHADLLLGNFNLAVNHFFL